MSNVQHVLFYSQITFAMNAARIHKSLAMDREFNRTERELITYSQGVMIINAAKIWDRTGYNIEKFIRQSNAKDDEKGRLLKGALKIKTGHRVTIDKVKLWRNKLIAHLDKDMNTTEQFNEFDGDVSDIQMMIQDVADLVSSASWYPEKNRPMTFLDYDQIKSELKL
ncbi:MAG: hypothetical protein WAV04_03340 [Candidatus Microsaccharimonas sp.]